MNNDRILELKSLTFKKDAYVLNANIKFPNKDYVVFCKAGTKIWSYIPNQFKKWYATGKIDDIKIVYFKKSKYGEYRHYEKSIFEIGVKLYD